MNRTPATEDHSKVRLGVAVGVILWMVGVFTWVVVFGENYIGPDADSAAFIARLAEND